MKQLKKLKIENSRLVLETIRKSAPISKKNISNITHLSSTLLTNICSELKNKGLICEGESVIQDKAGRREVLLDINYSFKKIIGFNISTEYSEIIISDLKPSLIYSYSLKTDLDNPENFLKKLIEHLVEYMQLNGFTEDEFLGIGISSKGSIHNHAGIIGEEIWHKKIDIKKYIEEHLKLPIFIGSDVKNLAIAENFFSPSKEDFFMIKYGMTGIGGAIFHEGKLYSQNNNSIGKIGHMLIDPKGEYCQICKRKGCMETVISMKKIMDEIQKSFSLDKTPILYKILEEDLENLSIDRIFEAYEEGCIVTNRLLRRSASIMAQGIINVSALFGSQEILLYGDFFKRESYQFLLKYYVQKYQLNRFSDKIKLSSLDTSEEKLAGCILVLKTALYEKIENYIY